LFSANLLDALESALSTTMRSKDSKPTWKTVIESAQKNTQAQTVQMWGQTDIADTEIGEFFSMSSLE